MASGRQRARGLRQLRYLQARRAQKLGRIAAKNEYGAQVIIRAAVNVYQRPLTRVWRRTARRAFRRTARRSLAQIFSPVTKAQVGVEVYRAPSRAASLRPLLHSAFTTLASRRVGRAQHAL